MKPLIYFNQSNLQKGDYFLLEFYDIKSSSPLSSLSTPRQRQAGDVVTSFRNESKPMQLRGTVVQKSDQDDIGLEGALAELDNILNLKERSILRWVPEYKQVIDTKTTTGWTASSDAENLAITTSKFQTSNSALAFDIDPSNSVDNFAKLTYAGATPVDISNENGETAYNFSIYIPDVYYISSIDIEVGSDASHYYAAQFTTNYNSALRNGWNHFSVLESSMVVTGTPNKSAFDYFEIQINYSASATLVQTCILDGVMRVNETRVRNYPSVVKGQVSRLGDPWAKPLNKFTADFSNYTGYSRSTHYYNVLSVANIDTTTSTQLFELEGSTEQLPEYTLLATTATDLASMSITNLNTNRTTNFNVDSIANGDTFIFGGEDYVFTQNGNNVDFDGFIPSAEVGYNRVRLDFSSLTPVNVPATPVGAVTAVLGDAVDYPPPANTTYYGYLSQKFVATQSYNITSISINWQYYAITNILEVDTAPISWWITNDSAGIPGNTVLSSGTIATAGYSLGATLTTSGLSIPVVSGTTYHVVFKTDHSSNNAFLGNHRWQWALGGRTDNPYASGNTMIVTSLFTTSAVPTSIAGWTQQANNDLKFSITLTPAPAWDVDLSIRARKLHNG